MDWNLILSKCMVINYIEKHASKSEKGYETFHDMLMCVSTIANLNGLATCAYVFVV